MADTTETAGASAPEAEAHAIFNDAWRALEKEKGRDALIFPGTIYWLNGAPGAGKGTHTEFLMRHLRLEAGPIVISDLLQSPEARKLKDAGLMVGDREVLGLFLRKLLEPPFRGGVIVDGFPRTMVQAECLKRLHKELSRLHEEKPGEAPQPQFRLIVLYVDEEISVRRQLGRAKKVKAGLEKGELRATDQNQEGARRRYQVFEEVTHEPLRALKKHFPCYFFDGGGTVEAVQEVMAAELPE